LRSATETDEPVANFVKVARRDEIPDGSGKTVEVGGRKIALFNAGGQFYAIDNSCRHRGGPLGEGDLMGTTVVCPWHGWEYDVTNGQSLDDPGVKVGCFAVRMDGDDILIEA
jgi:nitrite reductase (NADH) small subunit